MTQRLVSVVIGTRNRPDTLRTALASIRALEGDDLKFEILVGDNGTTPETRAVVEAFGGVYDTTDIYGCPAARNLAMRRMTGEFVAFLDDDDAWLEGHIRPHIAMLDAHPEFAAVFGQTVLADPDLQPTGIPWPVEMPADGDYFVKMMSGYYPQVGATLVRGDIARGYGVMDETLIGDSDWDWQLRIARDHRIGFVSVPCVLFRQRPKGTYDSLQLTRTKYTQKIWTRHAWPNRKRWPGLKAMARSYYACVLNYWQYFCEAAEHRIAQGDRGGALKAIASALWVFPTRTVRTLAGATPLRASLLKAASPGRLKRREPGLSGGNDVTGPIDVAFGFDDGYAPHAAATIASIVACAPGAAFRFVLVCSEVSAARRAMVERAAPGAAFVWVSIGDGDMPKFNNRDYFTRAILFRLGLEKFAPADSHRMIYLDSDMTVMRDLRELWNTDLKGNVIGAVYDTFVSETEFAGRWKLPGDKPAYFNSGMMLIDLDAVRKEGLFNKALDFVAEHGDEIRFADQDALNIVLWGRWLPLDVTWNVQRDMVIPGLAVHLPKHKSWDGRWPGVVHFTGTDKPWTLKGWHPWAWVYWRSLSHTPFQTEISRRHKVEPLHKLRMLLRWMKHKPRTTVTP